jgi:hypothetical protein
VSSEPAPAAAFHPRHRGRDFGRSLTARQKLSLEGKAGALNRPFEVLTLVMPALVAGIHVLKSSREKDADCRDERDERGHDVSARRHRTPLVC